MKGTRMNERKEKPNTPTEKYNNKKDEQETDTL